MNFGYITKENIKDHNQNWKQISYHLYRILINGGPGSGKANALHNLINQKLYTDNFYLQTKDPCKAKYQFLLSKR